MNSSAPREYLSLPTGERENYSEVNLDSLQNLVDLLLLIKVFGMRLLSPDTCPSNATRDSCPCVKDNSPRVGMSVWTKINLNITSLSINRKAIEMRDSRNVPVIFSL